MSDSVETIPVPQRENTKLAMWVFLGGEAVFFITLILLLVLTRLTHTDYDGGFRSYLSIPIIAGNTATKPELRDHFHPHYADFRMEYPDQLRADGKIYVVVAVLSIILAGVLVFLFLLDRKIGRLERELKA